MTLASPARGTIGMRLMTVVKTNPPMLIQVTTLALSRGGRLLFNDLSFYLWRQGILLVKGPNGVGKSSLLQVVAGILRPDAGRVGWYLDDPEAPKLHYLGHAPGVKSRLTAAENLRFWGEVNGPTGSGVDEALEQVGLGGLGSIEAGHLSAGQTRRLALARLLVSRRPVWLLDEPTSSLDAAGHELVGRMMRDHAASGGTVMAATHDHIPDTPAAHILELATPSAEPS
jgi:heme exporter protein A